MLRCTTKALFGFVSSFIKNIRQRGIKRCIKKKKTKREDCNVKYYIYILLYRTNSYDRDSRSTLIVDFKAVSRISQARMLQKTCCFINRNAALRWYSFQRVNVY